MSPPPGRRAILFLRRGVWESAGTAASAAASAVAIATSAIVQFIGHVRASCQTMRDAVNAELYPPEPPPVAIRVPDRCDCSACVRARVN